MSFEVGKVMEGKVSGITNFGAFIDLPEGKTGLVHISEVSEDYIQDIKSHLSQEQVVKVKVLSVNNGKISLSIKKAIEKKPQFKESKAFNLTSQQNGVTFEDKLAKFLKDSDERMLDLKRNIESKRGSSRR